ncbi:MAG: hypothetical protein HUU06_12170 [Planctomycetaceae bacterium]|nr:hypothetical protein [Planctomycetaceae bacterium]
MRFADLLRRFALDPRNAVIGEHEHHGPYMYLELMTSGTPGMDGGSIHGRPGDLLLLAGLIEERLASTRPGDRVRIEWECAAAGSFALVLDRREEGVDPASLDPLLPPAG